MVGIIIIKYFINKLRFGERLREQPLSFFA